MHPEWIAFRRGLASIVAGLLFCGLVLAIRNIIFFGLVGIFVLIVCMALVLSGFGMLTAHVRQYPNRFKQSWRPWLALAILILNFPASVICAYYVLTHFTLYSIKIVNASQQPLHSVSLRSEDGGSTHTLALIPSGHRFDTIGAGERVKVTWDARDEGGVRLRSTWNGRTTDFNVTGYTLWESPHDYTVRFYPSGKITVNGKAPSNP